MSNLLSDANIAPLLCHLQSSSHEFRGQHNDVNTGYDDDFNESFCMESMRLHYALTTSLNSLERQELVSFSPSPMQTTNWKPLIPFNNSENAVQHDFSKDEEYPDGLLKKEDNDNEDKINTERLDALYFASDKKFIGYYGLPTYDQCNYLVNAYVETLSAVKKDKSLVTRSMYQNIISTLKQVHGPFTKSAQFRFWAKRNFELFRDAEGNLKIMHKGKPIAIREDLYTILSVCHVRAEHGGRDKTLSQLRQWYSRVPKNMISQFIKMCPTCNPNCITEATHPEFAFSNDDDAQSIRKGKHAAFECVPLKFKLRSNIVLCKMVINIDKIASDAVYAKKAAESEQSGLLTWDENNQDDIENVDAGNEADLEEAENTVVVENKLKLSTSDGEPVRKRKSRRTVEPMAVHRRPKIKKQKQALISSSKLFTSAPEFSDPATCSPYPSSFDYANDVPDNIFSERDELEIPPILPDLEVLTDLDDFIAINTFFYKRHGNVKSDKLATLEPFINIGPASLF
ncbi:hypothetical protein V1514DRAFT_325261 [Lipomyces japonicus]|uniref:uncharacterized protein n=1 Tax=Lipomyces japonicus TaxID=56871 RepID=UPI0034CD9766